MGTAESFLLKLEQQISGPAGAAEGALAKLEAQIAREQQALAGLEGKLGDARSKLEAFAQLNPGGGGAKGVAFVDKQREAIRKLEEQIASGKGNIDKLGAGRGFVGQIGGLKDMAAAAKENEAAFAATSGPLGGFISKAQSLTGALGKSGGAVGAAVALAGAVLTVVAAVIGAIVALATFAIYASDAAKSARLLNEAAAGSAAYGEELTAVIADVANKTPLARDRITEMARSLEIAKIAGRDMQVTLEAMATVASAVGDTAAGKIKQIAESSREARRFLLGARDIYGEFASLSGTGVKAADVYAALAASMGISLSEAQALLVAGKVSLAQGLEALNDAVQGRFAKTISGQMALVSIQMKKLEESISSLFDGIDLGPFTTGLRLITDLFSQNTVSGRMLKLLLETVLQPLIDTSSTVFPIMRAFFQGLVIGAMLVVLGVLLLQKAYRDAFGGETQSSINWVEVALYTGVGLVFGMVAAVALLAAGFVVLAIVSAPLWLPLLLGAALMIAVFAGVIYAVYKVVSFFGSLNLGDAAQNMVNTFVIGIRTEIGEVANAMKAMGDAAGAALKRALGIASPSRLALEAAHNVTSTFAGKIEDGTEDTRGAFSKMVDPSAANPGGGGKGSSAAPTELHFHYHGGSTDEYENFKEMARAWYNEQLMGMCGEGEPA